jgi:hypothetical protein
MRIWIHLLLTGVAVFVGFIAGGILAALLLELIRDGPRWAVIPVVCVALVAFAYGGLRAGEWFVRQLPARCPKCRRAAYAEGHRPIRFRCASCGHVHWTNVRANWGSG